MHDTAGDSDLNVNRAIQYKDADLFIVCCATNCLNVRQLGSNEGFQKSVKSFADEIRNAEPNKPIVLVETKIDLKNETGNENQIEPSQIERAAKENNFQAVFRTSAK